MNKNFKVVFSKARGALMVVNELTSSVQVKGTKTVIAAAVASLVAGGAMAADTAKPGALLSWNGTELVGQVWSTVPRTVFSPSRLRARRRALKAFPAMAY